MYLYFFIPVEMFFREMRDHDSNSLKSKVITFKSKRLCLGIRTFLETIKEDEIKLLMTCGCNSRSWELQRVKSHVHLLIADFRHVSTSHLVLTYKQYNTVRYTLHHGSLRDSFSDFECTGMGHTILDSPRHMEFIPVLSEFIRFRPFK